LLRHQGLECVPRCCRSCCADCSFFAACAAAFSAGYQCPIAYRQTGVTRTIQCPNRVCTQGTCCLPPSKHSCRKPALTRMLTNPGMRSLRYHLRRDQPEPAERRCLDRLPRQVPPEDHGHHHPVPRERRQKRAPLLLHVLLRGDVRDCRRCLPGRHRAHRQLRQPAVLEQPPVGVLHQHLLQ
jgi:hypothetical protein